MADHGHGRKRPGLPEKASATAVAAVAKKRKRRGTNPFAGLSRRR